MNYLYENKGSKQTIILFHGTGGDAKGMLPLGNFIDSTANLISIEGNILENGMKRFFKRFSLGKYDLNSLKEETERLNVLLNKLIVEHQINIEQTLLVGFSNGANILQNYLRLYPNHFKNFALLHSSLIEDKLFPNLDKTNLFLTNSLNDPIISQTESDRLRELFEHSQANIESILSNTGHSLSKQALDSLHKWYEITIKG